MRAKTFEECHVGDVISQVHQGVGYSNVGYICTIKVAIESLLNSMLQEKQEKKKKKRVGSLSRNEKEAKRINCKIHEASFPFIISR